MASCLALAVGRQAKLQRSRASKFACACVQGKDGLLTLTGFGSLLSKKSAKSTFPDLQNWRVAKVCLGTLQFLCT